MPTGPETHWREALVADAAIRTGLLAELAGGATPEAAAAARGLMPRAVRVVCEALCDLGLTESAGDGRVRLTGRGRRLVEPGADGTDADADVGLTARSIAAHTRLADRLRGAPPPDDVSAGDRATRERFMRAMRHVSAPRAPATVALVGEPPPGGRLLDVGGAPGTYARAFAAAGWDVTVLDLPETLEISAAELRAAGIGAVAGDATEELPSGPWHAIYIGNVLHLLAPAVASALVARAGAALEPGGALVVQEVVGGLSPQAAGFAVLMLTATPDGEVHGAETYREWMRAAGCPLERLAEIDGGEHHLLIGRRA